MVKIVATEGEDFTILPKDAVITVRVDSTKVEQVPGKKEGDFWDKLDFTFTIVGVADPNYKDAEGQNIWGGVPFRLTDHPDNRLKQWVEALLGIEITEGFELDTDMLHGRTCRAIVENYPRKAGGYSHKVGALLPSGASVAQPDPAAAAAQQAFAAPAPTPAPQQQHADVPF